MLFTNFAFLVLVAVTLGLYYLPPLRRWQMPILIAASFVFYAWSQPALLLLLLASIGINAVCSYRTAWSGTTAGRRLWASLGVGLNLGILVFFKYSPLVATLLPARGQDDPVARFLVSIPLPVGISFFTFQGISLLVDVFVQKPGDAKRVEVDRRFGRHLLKTGFFKAFFPQLVAGPIVKAHDFYPQIGPKAWRAVPWESAFRSLVTGYFLKMVVADNLNEFTFWIHDPQFNRYSSLMLLTLTFGYSMQIFADFAGYSLIAIGVARLFGYELMQNFNFPYVSGSFAEFWTRWHISLSTWLREYLYIPLGGNRKGPLRTYFNLFAVMFLGGLWHGASWTYALWGTAHGAALAAERLVAGRPGPAASGPGRAARGALVFGVVTLGWLFFKLPDLGQVAHFVGALHRNVRIHPDIPLACYIALYSLPVVAWHALYLLRSRWTVPEWLRTGVYGAMLFALAVNAGPPSRFIYFQF